MVESPNAKEASNDAEKYGPPDGIGGAGLPKAAGNPPAPKRRVRNAAYERRKKRRLAKFGEPWQSTWSFD